MSNGISITRFVTVVELDVYISAYFVTLIIIVNL